jgi:acyl carrier protein
MAKIGLEAIERAGLGLDDLDVFVPHQANMRITDAMARSMKLPERVKIARDIAETGNTSAASVPLALDRMIEEGEARSGDKALLIAFGAGLAYAAQVVTVPKIAPPDRTIPHREGSHMATTEEIRTDLADIVNEVAGVDADDVQLDKSFVDDLDVDSLSMVEVVVAAEEKFDVKIPDDEVKNLKTVGDAVAFIERAQNG